jgi:hypothetical protein
MGEGGRLPVTSYVVTRNAKGATTVRSSDDELHRAARKGLHSADHEVFGLLPATVAQIIKHGAWKTRGKKFETFGEYVLDQTSDGLGVSNNQQLWLLKCAMDVKGKHIGEWADVLIEVEKAVRVYAKENGRLLQTFAGNDLETLARATDPDVCAITYLPSRQSASPSNPNGGGGGSDMSLVLLRRRHPDIAKRIARGEISLGQAKKLVGIGGDSSRLAHARSYIRRMSPDELATLIAWMYEEGYLK